MSRRGTCQEQDENHIHGDQVETVSAEGLLDPVVTTNISPVRLLKTDNRGAMRVQQLLPDVERFKLSADLCESSGLIRLFLRRIKQERVSGCAA